MGKNETTNKQFEVTLAHKRSDRLKLEQGVFIQPKLDGVRCYTRRGEDGVVRMFSRNHKEFKNCKHLTAQLEGFFDLFPHIILDGELYNHKFKNNFNKIISLVRKSKPTQQDRFESASYLQYHVYDYFSEQTPHWDFIDRNLNINTFFRMNWGWKSIKYVETKVVWSQEEVDKFHRINKDNGYEGSMLRANIHYEQRRSHGLQKVKDWSDTEMTITGYVEGRGKFANGLGKFLGVDNDGREVEVPWPNLTILDRQGIWHNRASYIGKTLTFEYFERTPDMAYRFPRAKAIRNYE